MIIGTLDSTFEIGLTLDEYQELALESAVYASNYSILYPALALAGEAGEVAEKIAKRLRDNDGDFEDAKFREAIKKELGDVLWNVAALADGFGLSLEDVAESNLTKLASRMERGMIQGSGDDR